MFNSHSADFAEQAGIAFRFSKKMQNGDGEPNNFFESFSEIDLGSDISGDLSGQEWWITDKFIVGQQSKHQFYPPKTAIFTRVATVQNRFESSQCSDCT